MGFLLLQYEYQRANRQCNLLTRTGIRLNDQIAKYTKRISKMESVFSKMQTQIENKYTAISNQASARLSQASNISAASGSSAFTNFNSAIGSIVIGGVSLGSLLQVAPDSSTDYTTNDGKAAMMSQLASAAAQAKAILSTLIQNQMDAEKEALEIQQDAQLNPISEKEGDLQAEQTTNDALITLWEQRRDAAKEKLPDAIQNSMGHYGIK